MTNKIESIFLEFINIEVFKNYYLNGKIDFIFNKDDQNSKIDFICKCHNMRIRKSELDIDKLKELRIRLGQVTVAELFDTFVVGMMLHDILDYFIDIYYKYHAFQSYQIIDGCIFKKYDIGKCMSSNDVLILNNLYFQDNKLLIRKEF